MRQVDGSDPEEFAFLSGPFRAKEDTEEECQRMSALSQYDGRSLGITFVAEAPKKRKPPSPKRQARRGRGSGASITIKTPRKTKAL